MVEVERSKSGEYWRMTYLGESDIIDNEPTDADKNLFMKAVNAQKARERLEATLPVGGHTSEVQPVNL